MAPSRITPVKNVSFRALDDEDVPADKRHLQFYECELCLQRWSFDAFKSPQDHRAELVKHNTRCFVYNMAHEIMEHKRQEDLYKRSGKMKFTRAHNVYIDEAADFQYAQLDPLGKVPEHILAQTTPISSIVDAPNTFPPGQALCVDDAGNIVAATPGTDYGRIIGIAIDSTRIALAGVQVGEPITVMTNPSQPPLEEGDILKFRNGAMIKFRHDAKDDLVDATVYAMMGRQAGKATTQKAVDKDFRAIQAGAKKFLDQHEKLFEREYMATWTQKEDDGEPW